MGAKEQEKPLAPVAFRIDLTEDEAISMELKKHYSHRKYVKCCGCIAALILIQVVTILVLIFTVFHVKNPEMKFNSVTIEGLARVNATNFGPLTLVAEVAVKNPNAGSFKFSNATTFLYYDGVLVGEAGTPPGRVKARRTVRLNVTIDVMVEKILGVPRLRSDLLLRELPVSSDTSISGQVKILKIVKKNVVVRMNCTMTVNITSRAIQDQNCRPHVLG